ncbi:MAG: ATP-binding cassette domain-containing protein [Eubacterium sp.]|nr:ATP-binding cassette domain-containing protein [Eubacterium sp.]SEG35313.1 ABC-2 type transport system ATP-binding protein [Eubacterium ruminantium]
MGLVVKDLFKKYGEKTVVDHISFSMDKPGVYALLGTNGAGKTTSIRMILDMLDKDGGEVLWNNGPLNFDTCNIGYLAEERGLYPKYTLMDQIKYFGSLRGVPEKELDRKIKYWAERLKVEEYLYPQYKDAVSGRKINEKGEFIDEEDAPAEKGGRKKPVRKKKIKPQSPDQLSKGNQQKIQFLIAMLSDPDLLVLDEPFSGLDPVNTDILKNVVREQIEAGKYIIMSSHQMEVVEEFCTDITILSRSKAVVQGNLNEIKKSYGRVNLHLKCESDVTKYIEAVGANIVSAKENEYRIKVTGDEQAAELLKTLVANNVNVICFDLSELSLHEIFVKEVGADEK